MNKESIELNIEATKAEDSGQYSKLRKIEQQLKDKGYDRMTETLKDLKEYLEWYN